MSSSSYLLFAFLAAPRAVELTLIGDKFCLALAPFGVLFLSLFHIIQHSYMAIGISFTYVTVHEKTMRKVVVGNGGLNSKFFSAHYAWFSHGRSHMSLSQ